MKKLVLVDFDDTLVETAPAFQQARDALFVFLEKEGFSREESSRIHYEEVEPELLERFGMGPFRMEPSFRETYRRLAETGGRPFQEELAARCGALGRDFLGRPRVMDGSLQALGRLARSFSTAILSQAAQVEYQMGRIRDAGITRILGEDRIRIIEMKTPESFQEALSHFGIGDPSQAVMIGNSLRSDINPALMAGAEAILVEPYEMWHYDNVPPVSPDFLRFPTFPEAVDHLCNLAEADGPGRPD